MLALLVKMASPRYLLTVFFFFVFFRVELPLTCFGTWKKCLCDEPVKLVISVARPALLVLAEKSCLSLD